MDPQGEFVSSASVTKVKNERLNEINKSRAAVFHHMYLIYVSYYSSRVARFSFPPPALLIIWWN